MADKSAEFLVEDRVAQLEAISERRNALLRQMHQMIRRRNGVGALLTLEHEDHDDLALFLKRFRITLPDTESGSITTLHQSELYSPSSPVPTPQLIMLSGDSPRVPHKTSLTSNDSVQLMQEKSPTPADSVVPSPLSQQSDEEHDELDLFREIQSSSRPKATGVPPSHLQRHILHELQRKVVPSINSADNNPKAPAGKGAPPAAEAESNQMPSSGRGMNVGVLQVHPLQGSTPTPFSQDSATSEESANSEDVVMTNSALYHTEEDEGAFLLSSSPHQKIGEPRATQDTIDHHPSYTFVPVVANSSKQAVIIPAFASALPVAPDFIFTESTFVPPPSLIPPIGQPRHHFEPHYRIPPSKYVYHDSNRKVKSTKRKREKDRERHEGRKDNDWNPMGLNRWAATLVANPVWKRVSRASKCLSTREWAIAMSELRLIRVMDRVEGLKHKGHWSFRQPKKQRGVGGLTKTHWDHLMDEMKWMRVDFREERKWKMTLAYTLSTAVLEWHAAGNREVRLAKRICVCWNPWQSGGEAVDSIREVDQSDTGEMEVDETPEHSASLLGVDYGSEDGEEDSDKALDPVVDDLEPAVLIKEALHTVPQVTEPQTSDIQLIRLKTDHADHPSLFTDDLTLTYAQIKPGDEGRSAADLEMNKPPLVAFGLKATSHNPTLGFKLTPSSSGEDLEQSTTAKTSSKINLYSPFRQMVINSDESRLFLDFDGFRTTRDTTAVVQVQDDMSPLVPPDLVAIFPELPTFNLLDVPPVVQSTLVDGKKRSEKRSDRDDPYKRSEDITYTRLFPAGDFMFSRPTLLGPLCPSKHWKNSQWLFPDESPSTLDIENATKGSEERMNELFDSRSSNAPSVLMALQLQAAFLRDKDNRRRSADHLWSAADDILLKSVIDKYPNNWALIAECFNASRCTISTDIRTPRECLERWRDKWGPDFRRPVDNSATVEDTSSPIPSQMTTRGTKRLASVSVSGPGTTGITPGNESRKRRRHIFIQETIRKAGKKRNEALQKQIAAQRKSPAVHETHAQYSKMPKRTPAELSRLKAEKEARELQDFQSARKRQEEMNRSNFSRDHPQRVNANMPVTPQPQQSATNPVQRPIPVIRNQVNISQQQRIGTPSLPVGSRSSPQHVLQVQVRGLPQQSQAMTQHQNNNNGPNGNVQTSTNSAHLSPPYTSEDAPSSPAHVPAGNGIPLTVNSPRPPSAQAHTVVIQAGNAGTRGGYYMPNVPGYTAEQLHNVLRTQHQQRPQSPAPPTGNGFPLA